MSRKTQGVDATATPARPLPGRRTRAVLFALAVLGGLVIGGGVAFAVGVFQKASDEEVAASVENFDHQVGVTNAAFSALESHIDEGNTVLSGLGPDAVEPGVADDLTVAVTEARDFADDHEDRPTDAEGLDIEEVDALTSELAGLAETADEQSAGIADAVGAVIASEQAVALSTAADDLDDAAKDLKAAMKKAKKVLADSEGQVFTEEGRTKLSDRLESAQKTLDEDVDRDDVEDLVAAKKTYEKTAKSVTKARKAVSEDVEVYEAELLRQAEIEAARPAEPAYEPPPPEPEPEPQEPESEDSPSEPAAEDATPPSDSDDDAG